MVGKHFTSPNIFNNYKRAHYFTLLQNAADFIPKCEKHFIQNTTIKMYKNTNYVPCFISKCNDFILKCEKETFFQTAAHAIVSLFSRFSLQEPSFMLDRYTDRSYVFKINV